MKRTRQTLAAGLLLLAPPMASAQDDAPVRSISVTGTVKAETPPDQILWQVSLVDTDKDMGAAKAASDERVRSVVALREKLGVKEGDLETGTVQIRREYHQDDRGRRGEFKHFVVSRSVTIRQRDLSRFDEFLDSLVASTEMEVSFSFESSKIHEVRASARLKALATARDKAAAMAGVVGAKLGRVLTINEHASGSSWQSQANLFTQNNMSFNVQDPVTDVASDRFVPGAIDVKMTVYATFELK